MIQVLRETHEASCAVDGALRLAGGCNRFGEANYRAVWGWSRLGWIGGKWEDRDAAGVLVREVVELRLEPKYTPHNRWHIERWLPPESYGSPEQWYAQTLEIENGRNIAALGPYPSRGEFVQLTPTVARHVARLIESSRLAPRVKRREALDERVRREEYAYDTFADALLSDAGPAFHGLPRVVVTGDQ